MHKLPAVEEAKALFEEAKEWGVWKWLTEKKQLRRTADAAWEALEGYEAKLKKSWEAETRKAVTQHFRQADKDAHQARMDAEAQFDEADRRLSTSMAREGAQMAIDAWTKREKLIRKMEAMGKEE